jgi:hypothetical protein
MIILIPFVFTQVILFTSGPVGWNDEIWLISFFAGIYCIMPILMYWGCKNQMERTPYFKEKLQYIINEDNIEIAGDSFTNKSNWQYVNMLTEREKYFLMYNLNRTIYYLPKDGFESKEAAANFKNMVKEKGIKFSYN